MPPFLIAVFPGSCLAHSSQVGAIYPLGDYPRRIYSTNLHQKGPAVRFLFGHACSCLQILAAAFNTRRGFQIYAKHQHWLTHTHLQTSTHTCGPSPAKLMALAMRCSRERRRPS